MAQQPLVLGHNIEPHVIDEFVTEYNDSHAEIELLLLKLENNPTDTDLLNNLFRQVHSIKGNSHFLGLDLISDFVHALESVLDKVRKHDLMYDKYLGEVVLLCVDYIGELYSHVRHRQTIDGTLGIRIQDELRNLSCSAQLKAKGIAQRIIGMFDQEHILTSMDEIELLHQTADVNFTSQELEDLRFYAQLIERAEQRSPFWKDRSQHILNIALAMNGEAGLKVNSTQLEAAVYLHDFYMAFLPLELLHKGDKLSEYEFQSLKLHPQMGAALLGDNSHWREAAAIIAQHHEREDGNGYPEQRPGGQICDGAKIIAIADAFESMTNQRAHRTQRIPVSQAIKEINRYSGTQFSPFWVEVFNDVIRNISRTSHKS